MAYLEKMEHKSSLFDAPPVRNLHKISTADKADMRSVFDETLVQCEPYNAVTLVSYCTAENYLAVLLNLGGMTASYGLTYTSPLLIHPGPKP